MFSHLEDALSRLATLEASIIALQKQSRYGKTRIYFQTCAFLNVVLSSPNGGNLLES